jgi:tetratricopeptide (TPR) repeat protein
MLLDESKRRMPSDPGSADELAEAAQLVIRRSILKPGMEDLSVLAALYRANVARLRDRPDEARSRFSLVRSIIRTQGVTDLLVYAEVDSCEAVFELEIRRFPEAEDLLNRAIALYVVAGERSRTAHPLITLGLLYHERGESRRAVEVTRQAQEIMGSGADLRLRVCAQYNIALFLCESGEPLEAAEVLEEGREMFLLLQDPYTKVRLTWLDGKIALALGHLAQAEDLFLSVREAFSSNSQPYDVAMVSMDLATVYVRENRHRDLIQVAEEMIQIFTAQKVGRELFAACLLFQEAARGGQVTMEMIERLVVSLKSFRSSVK